MYAAKTSASGKLSKISRRYFQNGKFFVHVLSQLFMNIKGFWVRKIYFLNESIPDAEFLAAYISAVNPLNSFKTVRINSTQIMNFTFTLKVTFSYLIDFCLWMFNE